MNYNKHSNLEGAHAFLGASKYHWINYDESKIAESYYNFMAIQNGTEMHELAKMLIQKRTKLPKSTKTLNAYVNDAIGYRMKPEQILYYSDNCFGTTDAISSLDSVFKTNVLRIHDLKTGVTKAHIEQLRIYAALFCLEYKVKPVDISIQLRIYQSDSVFGEESDPVDILKITDSIISFDKVIAKIKSEEE